MKKTTGIIFLIAVALLAATYFYDWKGKPASEIPADTTKPVFTVSSSDIGNITVHRAGTTIVFERQGNGWAIVQPVTGLADSSVLDGITSELSSVRVARTFPAAPDRLGSFGLTDPVVTIDFTAKGGAKHTLRLGSKDFSGASVFALADDSKNVALLSDTILTSSDKPLDDFRDHTVLPLQTSDVSSFDLRNASGDYSLVKSGLDWKIEKPRATAADSATVSSLLDAIASARVVTFASDNATDLPKYGLAKPLITFRASLAGGKTAELQIGKKEGDGYDARDPSRPVIFRVNATLFTSLNQKLFDLRDKQLVHISASEVTRAEIHNPNGSAVCVPNSSGDLVVQQAPSAKTTPPACPSFLLTLEGARATDIYDAPPADISAKLAKPVIEITLTEKSGKKTELRVSVVSGDAVYAKTSAGPQIYKLDKEIFTELNLKPPAATK